MTLPKVIIIITDRFCMALFSAPKQTHCTQAACVLNERLWPFKEHFLNIHQSATLTALFGCCMAGATWNCCCLSKFCVHHTTMDQFTVSLYTVRVCLAVTCHLHFWQNDWDLLHATVVRQGGTDTKIRVITECWLWWWCPLWVWLNQVAAPIMCVIDPGGFVHSKCD